MALVKYANAAVTLPLISEGGWNRVRTAAAKHGAQLSGNLVQQASEILQEEFDPSKYLLTHTTLVASVDTTEVPSMKVGSFREGGFKGNRKFADFRITQGTQKYINNNWDAWNRPVLLASYKTFIGGHNFVEHVQIEEQSKGRIIDAVARDIGDSVYVDLLIATSLAHEELVAAIRSGKMGTLSMGCTVDGTICTRCGHWAADETEMCPHIKYEKGNLFFDSNGQQQRIAELCGHQSIAPTAGVNFIEASWVGTPAFTGAVLRNILQPTPEISRRAQAVLAQPPKEWAADARRIAASTVTASTHRFGGNVPVIAENDDRLAAYLAQFDDEMGLGEGEGGGEEPAAPAAPPSPPEKASPFKELEDDVYQMVTDRVKKRVKDDLGGDEHPSGTPSEVQNETLMKQAAQKTAALYRAGLEVLARTARSDAHLVEGVATLDLSAGIAQPVAVYRSVLAAGGIGRYASPRLFLEACCRTLGRQPTEIEAKTLVRLGRLMTAREQFSTGKGQTDTGK